MYECVSYNDKTEKKYEGPETPTVMTLVAGALPTVAVKRTGYYDLCIAAEVRQYLADLPPQIPRLPHLCGGRTAGDYGIWTFLLETLCAHGRWTAATSATTDGGYLEGDQDGD